MTMAQQQLAPAELAARLDRWHTRLQNLPSIAVPTDYPRPSTSQLVQALSSSELSNRTRTALVRLALHSDLEAHPTAEDGGDGEDEEAGAKEGVPTPFHLLLAAFAVLLHRYTGDTDLVIGSSSPYTGEPLILRIPIEPGDPFWQIVRRVQAVEAEAAADAVPYEEIVRRVEADKAEKEGASEGAPSAPIFRVRFFDETGGRARNFMQSTSLTTDLTVFVTRPGVSPGAEIDQQESTPATPTKASPAMAPPAATTSSFRDPLVPAIALHLSYNALLFSAPRISAILSQLSHLIIGAAANPTAPVGSISLRTQAENAVLPDPRRDLDFCGWRGSITEIFERNAREFPDRRCIVESLPPPPSAALTALPPPASNVREVSYGQIDRASNVLAHHLVRGGVQREEVVTVYAHRGVDLVVAVLGTLKAGATFSVIDPAYPPSRQNVYLQVAKPRALVVLAKAGTLHQTVRQCIDTELEIRVEVPALELQPDGSIKGGSASAGAADVLTDAQALAGESTKIVLGPDSVGTLSFTSGSTGIPKGVRGRHHSLTHFFPWMGERFGLGAHERFTMLSGIAHDPIQRDIFTPLFFGAELHIPTADDIGTPGRLAEWMAASKASVTHLTPAMGQLLSAQAVAQIASLRNAFFVGDVLTKRDCTRLQSLAANVRIVNMYGTTETQRAVSYFAIPPVSENSTFLATQKDIMPAGQGMQDVQLLVVNRHERTATCAVGEVGEIYVRSGGLAEGYLGPASVTAEKFLPNFLAPDIRWEDTLSGPPAQFWKGVRDRMYRTGDLGRYLPDGTVECTGRADDQVKIRGFRIELGEIDTHLSRHPLVRENVTLVRRDKDEEKVLVSYFVPGAGAAELEEKSSAGEGEGEEQEDGKKVGGKDAGLVRGMRRNRRLIKDIRDYLKKKLPSYSVPTLFVPLGRMPLNPNGKIDKPALPFPDTAVASAAFSSSTSRADAKNSSGVDTTSQFTATEKKVMELWSSLLPNAPHPLPLDESFFDLGGHSILATRLVFEMRKAFVVNVPLGVVFDAPTIGALAKEVDHLRDADLNLGVGVARSGSEEQNAERTNASNQAEQSGLAEDDYSSDVEALESLLPESFPSAGPVKGKQTVLLTGATGFLGAFVLRDLLVSRASSVGKVICHVRAGGTTTSSAQEAAIARLRESGEARGAWDEEWITSGRLTVVLGDLAASERLGVSEEEWRQLAEEVDTIVHNGAMVHWVYPYSKLRAANVMSTICAIRLASLGKPKTFTFVSSTSALDTEHYVRLSDSLIHSHEGDASEPCGIPESDDLGGSARGLKSGYGQSKYVAERLTMLAAQRGLKAAIVRPGYVVGDSQSAVTNTDDFVWRLVKGCTQLGLVPDMHNTINMVPVDHVARITSLAALAAANASPEKKTGAKVYHVTAHPEIRFNGLLGSLAKYGWKVQKTEYVHWRTKLEQHVMGGGADNALFPLLHFVLDDLPLNTKSPALDDRNTRGLLRQMNEEKVVMGVEDEQLGIYLAFLVQVGFLEPPPPPSASASAQAQGAQILSLPKLSSSSVRAIGRSTAG